MVVTNRNVALRLLYRSVLALRLRILTHTFVVSTNCVPAVCMLVIDRSALLSVVLDVQSVCMVWPWRILHRRGPLPLGTKLII